MDDSSLSITVTFDKQLPDIQIAKREASKPRRVPNNPLQTLDLVLLLLLFRIIINRIVPGKMKETEGRRNKQFGGRNIPIE